MSIQESKRAGSFIVIDQNATIIFVSIGGLVLAVVIFAQARLQYELARANDARALAEVHVAQLREANINIRKQIKMGGLNPKQQRMISRKVVSNEIMLPSHFKRKSRGRE